MFIKGLGFGQLPGVQCRGTPCRMVTVHWSVSGPTPSPLQVGKDYLLCDYNRDGDSYRWSREVEGATQMVATMVVAEIVVVV